MSEPIKKVRSIACARTEYNAILDLVTTVNHLVDAVNDLNIRLEALFLQTAHATREIEDRVDSHAEMYNEHILAMHPKQPEPIKRVLPFIIGGA